MWKEHTTHAPNRDWWIGDYRLSQLIAMEPGYTTNRELRVPVEIEDVLWVWHSWSQVNSDWMCCGRLWKLQERDIERRDNCFGGALGMVDCIRGTLGTVDSIRGILCLVSFGSSFSQSSICVFFTVSHLWSWYCHGGVCRWIWVWSSHRLV
jgi:hypothetical protein